MSVEQRIEDQHQARLSLVQCALYRRERDNIIRRAHQAGITYAEIARILGMNRGHVSDIGNAEPGGSQSASEAEGPAQQPKDDTP